MCLDEAKVRDFDVVVVVLAFEQEVLRLEVAVRDVAPVQVRERVEQYSARARTPTE